MAGSLTVSQAADTTSEEEPDTNGQPQPIRIHSQDFISSRNENPTGEAVTIDEEVSSTETQPATGMDFASCWNKLFTDLFHNNYLIYYSLNDEVPDFEDNIIKIVVKNGIQHEEFESKKKAILEYWRNHFDINVDDIEITVNEDKEVKKVIINAQDKMENMAEQNPELQDFLNILNFRIKD